MVQEDRGGSVALVVNEGSCLFDDPADVLAEGRGGECQETGVAFDDAGLAGPVGTNVT
jgi:hypothetical protein